VGARVAQPVNVWDYERLAERELDPGAFGYFAGGAGDEHTLRDNVAAFRRWQLRPRVCVDVGSVSASTTVVGSELSMPLLVAPVAFQRMAHPDGERAVARAAAAEGTAMCLSTMATAAPAELRAAAPEAKLWFQVYVFRDYAITQALIDQAVEAGFEALVVTVDMPLFGPRDRDLRTGFEIPADITVPSWVAGTGASKAATPKEIFQLVTPSFTWRDLEALVAESPLPVVLKGVQTAEDGRLACEHGAAAVVVSNHGGRQLDGVAATLDLLPEVVEAVDGRVEVLMDGGIRRGTDVLKALALGAKAVLAGRAVVWGLAVGGEQGARDVLGLLKAETELGLGLLGCASPGEVTRAHLARAAVG
jgi:isopentenyl diphosphate isomerase/L-lactate dehydrogenase-like FMN-dependent dehydrogenase